MWVGHSLRSGQACPTPLKLILILLTCHLRNRCGSLSSDAFEVDFAHMPAGEQRENLGRASLARPDEGVRAYVGGVIFSVSDQETS